MTELLQIYRCDICGNIVQVMHSGNGELVCCGKRMNILIPYEQKDEKGEKHVPIFTKDNKIVVGSVPHPMLEGHYIEFIEAVSEDKSDIRIKFLSPNVTPSMDINNDNKYSCAVEYCNIHGLWRGENNNL